MTGNGASAGPPGSNHDTTRRMAGEEREPATPEELRCAKRVGVAGMAAQMTQFPTTPKGRRTRSRLLASARRVLARNGYVSLKMIDVAEEAGVSLGALYRYFRNKEDLFRALVDGIHEALFEASRAPNKQLATDPKGALLEANRGYLSLYSENRDVMRALIEASTVDKRFRSVWWAMRNRHVDRFVGALKAKYGIEEVDGVPARLVAEAMAAMVEQCAYVWFAQEEQLNEHPVSVDDAARIVTRIWHDAFFEPDARSDATAETGRPKSIEDL